MKPAIRPASISLQARFCKPLPPACWLLTITIVYALPTLLQIPMFTLDQCFWSLAGGDR